MGDFADSAEETLESEQAEEISDKVLDGAEDLDGDMVLGCAELLDGAEDLDGAMVLGCAEFLDGAEDFANKLTGGKFADAVVGARNEADRHIGNE
ncbi:MAG: hypothetical protein ABI238_04780 [Terrimesophilobacter sp.]